MSDPPSLEEVHTKLIELIGARGREDRYAALLSKGRTSAAQAMTFDLYRKIAGRRKAASAFGGVDPEEAWCSWMPLSVSLATFCAQGLTRTPAGASIAQLA